MPAKTKKNKTLKVDYTDYGPQKVAVVPVVINSRKRMMKIPYGSVECVLRSIALTNDSKRAKELLEDMIEICHVELYNTQINKRKK